MEQMEPHDDIEWISLKDAAKMYNVAKSTISRIADRMQIAKSNDPVDSKIVRVDRTRLAAVMRSSVKYNNKKADA